MGEWVVVGHIPRDGHFLGPDLIAITYPAKAINRPKYESPTPSSILFSFCLGIPRYLIQTRAVGAIREGTAPPEKSAATSRESDYLVRCVHTERREGNHGAHEEPKVWRLRHVFQLIECAPLFLFRPVNWHWMSPLCCTARIRINLSMFFASVASHRVRG